MDEGKIDDAALRIIFMVELPPAFLDFRKGSTWMRKRCPSGVREISWPVRSKRGWPSSFSSFVMERDRADCEMEMEAAAFVKWRICASARKYSSWLRSMGGLLYKIRDSFFV
jgi:hypothetical protein